MSAATTTRRAAVAILASEKVAEKVRARLDHEGAPVLKPRLLTVEKAAIYLGRSTEAMQHLLAAGKLRAVRTDRRVFLDILDLDRWIDQSKT